MCKFYFHTLQKGKNASLQILNHCPAKGSPKSVAHEKIALTKLTLPIIHPNESSHIIEISGLSTTKATFLPKGL